MHHSFRLVLHSARPHWSCPTRSPGRARHARIGARSGGRAVAFPSGIPAPIQAPMASPDQTDILVIGAGISASPRALALAARGPPGVWIDRPGRRRRGLPRQCRRLRLQRHRAARTPGIIRRAPLWCSIRSGRSLFRLPMRAHAPGCGVLGGRAGPRRYRAGVTAQAALMALSETALEGCCPGWPAGPSFGAKASSSSSTDRQAIAPQAYGLALRLRHRIAWRR